MSNSPDCTIVYGMYTEADIIPIISDLDTLDPNECDIWDEVKKKYKIALVTNTYYDDAPYHIIGIPKTLIGKGNLFETLDVHKMSEQQTQNEDAWNQQIKDFCKIIGIRYKQPKWYVMGDYC